MSISGWIMLIGTEFIEIIICGYIFKTVFWFIRAVCALSISKICFSYLCWIEVDTIRSIWFFRPESATSAPPTPAAVPIKRAIFLINSRRRMYFGSGVISDDFGSFGRSFIISTYHFCGHKIFGESQLLL